MRRLLIPLSALLILSSRVSGQEAHIANLRQQIRQHPQSDTLRVNRLNQLGQLDVSAAEKDSLARQALYISRKINYSIGEGFALINQASASKLKGNKSQQLLILEQANAVAEKTQDNKLVINTLLANANAKLSTQNKLRLSLFLKADSIAETLGDTRLLATCQSNIAAFYETSLSDYPKAMEWVLKSINTADEVNSLDNLARS